MIKVRNKRRIIITDQKDNKRVMRTCYFKIILWGKHYPDTKIKQRHNKKTIDLSFPWTWTQDP